MGVKTSQVWVRSQWWDRRSGKPLKEKLNWRIPKKTWRDTIRSKRYSEMLINLGTLVEPTIGKICHYPGMKVVTELSKDLVGSPTWNKAKYSFRIMRATKETKWKNLFITWKMTTAVPMKPEQSKLCKKLSWINKRRLIYQAWNYKSSSSWVQLSGNLWLR